MAAPVLQGQHHGNGLINSDLPSLAQVAYIIVLTIDTEQIAIGQEDSSRPAGRGQPKAIGDKETPAPADQWCLFPEVRMIA